MRPSLRLLAVAAALVVTASAAPDEEARDKEGPPAGERRGEDRGKKARPERGDERRHGPGAKGPRRGGHAAGMMKKFDENKDGKISFEEFQSGEKVEHLTEEGKRRIFDHFDRNKDGAIEMAELPHGGDRMPGDKNKDGKISREEFLQNPRTANLSKEKRMKLFERMDNNKDGFLSRDDWPRRPDGSRGWDRRPPAMDRNMHRELDRDKDGALSFEEWKRNPRYQGQSEERLKDVFERLDRNNDGKLNSRDRPEGGPRRGPRPGGDSPEGKRGEEGGHPRSPGENREGPGRSRPPVPDA